ncbi:hypothetical protein ACOMHN_003938 [Nucella lapillus]
MALPAALTAKRVRVATVILCAILLLLSFIIIIALAFSSSEAGGRCLLYADQSDFGPSSACGYIYTVTAVFQLLCCLVRAVLTAVIMAGLVRKQELLSNKHVMLGCGVVDVTACLLTLGSGGILSHGFAVMCSKVFYPYSEKCGTLAFYSLSSSTFVKNYYARLNIAQAAIWISWIVWILLVLADLVLLWKADALSDIRNLTFCLSGEGNSNTNSAIRRDKDTNQSQRSGVFLLKRSGAGDSDTESGPRTPPPRRPVPPRPPNAAGTAGAGARTPPSVVPLMKEDRLRAQRC